MCTSALGPDLYGDLIGTALKATNSERENLMILRLLEMMPLPVSLPYLNRFIAAGHLNIRLKAADTCAGGDIPRRETETEGGGDP